VTLSAAHAGPPTSPTSISCPDTSAPPGSRIDGPAGPDRPLVQGPRMWTGVARRGWPPGWPRGDGRTGNGVPPRLCPAGRTSTRPRPLRGRCRTGIAGAAGRPRDSVESAGCASQEVIDPDARRRLPGRRAAHHQRRPAPVPAHRRTRSRRTAAGAGARGYLRAARGRGPGLRRVTMFLEQWSGYLVERDAGRSPGRRPADRGPGERPAKRGVGDAGRDGGPSHCPKESPTAPGTGRRAVGRVPEQVGDRRDAARGPRDRRRRGSPAIPGPGERDGRGGGQAKRPAAVTMRFRIRADHRAGAGEDRLGPFGGRSGHQQRGRPGWPPPPGSRRSR